MDNIYAIAVTRLSASWLDKQTLRAQQDKVMEESGEVFAASRAMEQARARGERKAELARYSADLANEIIDLITALYGLAYKHGVTRDELHEAASRVRARNQKAGRV